MGHQPAMIMTDAEKPISSDPVETKASALPHLSVGFETHRENQKEHKMKTLRIVLSAMLLTCCVAFTACSESKDQQPPQVKIDPAAEQRAKAIRDELRAPINKAEEAQQMGDERTEAIDRVLRQK
jgi:hypothetical protein